MAVVSCTFLPLYLQAAATADSLEADAMLVKNAQNLMDAVQRTVRACEVASLRQTDRTARTPSIRFRKKGPRTSQIIIQA